MPRTSPSWPRGGLRTRLEALGHTVVGIAADDQDAVTQAGVLTPDLVFLDIWTPRLDGIQAAERLMAQPPPIIILTAHADPELIERAMAAGGHMPGVPAEP